MKLVGGVGSEAREWIICPGLLHMVLQLWSGGAVVDSEASM